MIIATEAKIDRWMNPVGTGLIAPYLNSETSADPHQIDLDSNIVLMGLLNIDHDRAMFSLHMY